MVDRAATPAYAARAGGVRIFVRVTPKAGRNRIGPAVRLADGAVAFKVQVTAVPEDGKANAAVIKLVAKKLGVAKSRVSVAGGATARRKVLHVDGDTDALLEKLARWE